MNNERITLIINKQEGNDILIKFTADKFKTPNASLLTNLSEIQLYRKNKSIGDMVLILFLTQQK